MLRNKTQFKHGFSLLCRIRLTIVIHNVIDLKAKRVRLLSFDKPYAPY
ncbi:hypothetical protein GPLA_0632 [Paraglaciecola polaris LMG 21857]|uniref:Uncharacterized protein n=1 Tax=Paraglaciecola polaris LMG 21857 TaxID=1129793 RepID=K6ZRS8_9ALTE|nr:hypothetical protein GPLA_0632 [Paraglaciecola polaris LMG 21857]